MNSEKEKNVCFVIMPYGMHFDKYYDKIYFPAIEELNLEPLRADNLYKPSTIVQDIWNLIQSSSIIIADLTGKNANVFYELGLAHASAKPVILISESMEDVPFDLRALRVLTYDKNDWNWGETLKLKIKKSIQETLKSPLKSVLPAFLEVEPHEKVTKATKEFLELKNEIELLKLQVNTGDQIEKTVISNQDTISILLSKREEEVLKLIAKGLTTPQISEELFIAPSTVEAHRRNLIDKIGTKNSLGLVKYAIENGIL